MKPETASKLKSGCFNVVLVLILFFILFGVALGPMGPGIRREAQSGTVQTSRSIALSMFQYANDHDNQYPDGASSTEVFQKLMDGGYISDATMLYLPLAGKIKPEFGQKKLKPENVGWDITGGGVDGSTSDSLPVVFITGFKVNYSPGGTAVPLPKSPAAAQPPSWWHSTPELIDFSSEGIGVTYKNNSARFIRLDPDGTVHNFVPPEFQSDGKTYRQLTPDGVLR